MTPECACRFDGGLFLGWLDAGACQAPTSTYACCEGNPDPCCPYTSYLGTECHDQMYPACACELDGGAWTDASATCEMPGDAGGD